MTSNKIAVIGAGSVGAAVSYALLLRQLTSELLLVDIDTKKVNGEVADLTDGAYLTNTVVRAGTPKEAGQCDIIVITAGAKQKEGETRIQLMDRNYNILKSVISSMQPIQPKACLVIVANPCDVLTYFAQNLSGLPKERVFGSGTFLDTCRLRVAISQKIKVAPTAVHAYVLGEHGDSQFVAWSSANAGNIPLLEFPEFKSKETLETMANQTKNKAYEIIQAKGATYFGIAAIVSSICECILFNQKHIRPLSVYLEKYGVCLSVPVVLGSDGVERILPFSLSEDEEKQLSQSAKNLYDIIQKYNF